MTIRIFAIAACLGAGAMLSPALAADQAPSRQTAAPVFEHAISNIPGKSLVAVRVDYAPGAKSAPHRHAGSAFIYAYVLSGAIRSQIDDEPAKIYHAGESWFEPPGAHHKISENVSSDEPAQLLAIFVVDTDDRTLTRPDKE
jgi:quercetin dioxygenase-like cupin family protein